MIKEGRYQRQVRNFICCFWEGACFRWDIINKISKQAGVCLCVKQTEMNTQKFVCVCVRGDPGSGS